MEMIVVNEILRRYLKYWHFEGFFWGLWSALVNQAVVACETVDSLYDEELWNSNNFVVKKKHFIKKYLSCKSCSLNNTYD